jgi:heat shock protein HtpX
MVFGLAFALIFIQFIIGPKIVEWSMKVHYINENEYQNIHKMVEELSTKALMLLRLDAPKEMHVFV